MQIEITNKNYKYIKIKGCCPVCNSKVVIGVFGYAGEPWANDYQAVCTNNDCDEAYGGGEGIKIRFVNHKTAKVEGLYD